MAEVDRHHLGVGADGLGCSVGAFVYEFSNHFLIQYTQDWQLVLGVVLLAIVLLRPDGLAGAGSALSARIRHARARRAGSPRLAPTPNEMEGERHE